MNELMLDGFSVKKLVIPFNFKIAHPGRDFAWQACINAENVAYLVNALALWNIIGVDASVELLCEHRLPPYTADQVEQVAVKAALGIKPQRSRDLRGDLCPFFYPEINLWAISVTRYGLNWSATGAWREQDAAHVCNVLMLATLYGEAATLRALIDAGFVPVTTKKLGDLI